MRTLIKVLLLLLLPLSVFAETEIGRGLNYKKFDKGGGQNRYIIHGKPLHYQEVEDQGDWIDIDINLEDKGAYYEITKGLFKVMLKKQSNGNFVRFQNRTGEYLDSGLRAIGYWDRGSGDFEILATASNVTAELYPHGTYNNAVIWRDIFPDVHCEVAYDNHSLKENIYLTQDARDILPNPTVYGMTPATTFLVFATECDFDNLNLPTKPPEGWDSTDKFEFRNAAGKLRFFFPVTSARHETEVFESKRIRRKLIKHSGKWWLLTGVPVLWIYNATAGTIIFDPPTSFFSGAGDGYAKESDAVWATAQGGPGDGSDYVGSFNAAGAAAASWDIFRGFYSFDTEGIADGDTVDACDFYITIWVDAMGAGDEYGVVEGLQASPTELADGDYDACGDAIDNPTEGAPRVDPGGSETEFNFSLNATGLGWINKTGYTQLGVRSEGDMDDAEPLGNQYSLLYTSEEGGTAKDPYLDITTSVPAGGVPQVIIITTTF